MQSTTVKYFILILFLFYFILFFHFHYSIFSLIIVFLIIFFYSFLLLIYEDRTNTSIQNCSFEISLDSLTIVQLSQFWAIRGSPLAVQIQQRYLILSWICSRYQSRKQPTILVLFLLPFLLSFLVLFGYGRRRERFCGRSAID